MKTNLLFFLLFCIPCVSLVARVVSTTILENPADGKRVALYNCCYLKHGDGDDDQFSKICQNIHLSQEPLLILNGDFSCCNYCYKFTSELDWWHRLLLMKGPASVESILKKFEVQGSSEDPINVKLTLLNAYNCFPNFVAYKGVDCALFSFYSEIFDFFYNRSSLSKSLLTCFDKGLVSPGVFCDAYQPFIEKIEPYFIEEFRVTQTFMRKDFLSKVLPEISFKDLKNPNLSTLLKILGLEINYLKNIPTSQKLKDMVFKKIRPIEEEYCEIQKYCHEIFSAEELQMPCSKLMGTIARGANKKKLLGVKHIFAPFDLEFCNTIVRLEIFFKILEAKHKKIAVFLHGNYTKNLLKYLMVQGWDIVHETREVLMHDSTPHRYVSVPFSDFDFLK